MIQPWVLAEPNRGKRQRGWLDAGGLDFRHPVNCSHTRVSVWLFGSGESQGRCSDCGYLVKKAIPRQDVWDWETR